ncbi:Na+/H+ antiporter NhaA [Microbispora hainanensis]|uniref:Na(+)/H(+) antiporter NhaA n=1 Tax=Microbispora hainanensis TaxID=568844 RepID=A0A544YV87_9ACTN|nr:Na+/H+ antiporter NhaA [Microbispora hainanensis]TQS20684.1 Na+/H+ antiporter NhaA [Microbispora hainanensis]
MTNVTVIQTSLDPERGAAGARRRPSIAGRIGAMGQNRIGALILLVATLAAIVWANVSLPSYETFWQTDLMVGVGDRHLDFTLHTLVNDALMAIFFFTVGLEVRREFSIGELTSWSRALVPVAASIAGLVVPALLFVLIAKGSGNEHAWGVVISTDTAFLVGALALIGPRVPGRLRVFLLALAVVDDIGALSIIALVYTEKFTPLPLLIAAAGLAGVYVTRYLPSGRGPVYVSLAIVVWLAFLASGVHPTLAGVVIALLVPVYRPNRTDVEHALELARTFRQSPNTEYARAAANSLRESISINERLQSAYAPYVAYVILPLFALANAGVVLSSELLAGAARSTLTWGIVGGLVAGKLLGVFGSSALLRRLKLGELGAGLTLDRVLGGAVLCGIGFTISLFIVDLAIDDELAKNEARVGVLAASVIAFVLATITFRISDAARPDDDSGQTLARPVDPERDHVLGDPHAPFTIVEYGDFQCGFCLKATGSILEVRDVLGDRLRYVWRHAPLVQIHPNALAAAEAAEAAAAQGRFFDFARTILDDQDNQLPSDIIRIANDLGLDLEQFEKDLISAEVTGRVRDDMLDAEAMNITAVPTLFINGRRHVGPYDARSLLRALTATTDTPVAE